MTAPASNRPRLPLRQALRYGLHSIVLFSALGLLRLFSLDRASAIGAWFGRTVLAPFGRSKSTFATLRTAYPDVDDAAAKRLLTGMMENLGRIVAEMAHLESFVTPAGAARLTFEGVEHLRAAEAQGRGVMVISGHFGNWELVTPALHRLGAELSIVTRPPNNPWVAAWIASLRARVGAVHQIPKGRDGTRAMFSTLRRGETLLMLIDQHLAQGIPAPLFGVAAMTTHAPAILAERLNVPVVPMSVRRTEGAHFQIGFHPAVEFAHSGNSARDILEMTTALNGFIEAEIRRRPEHWLWMHKRFKPVETLSRRADRLVRDTRPVPDA